MMGSKGLTEFPHRPGYGLGLSRVQKRPLK
jgi:hypothetical protein